jgi:tetratricopeptide (TPR) repeat protein
MPDAMNTSPTPSSSAFANTPAGARFARLEQLLQQDPENALLLSDAADAAIAAASFARAEELIGAGLHQSGAGAAWQFRQATLRIAQRRLDEARDILRSLEAAQGPHPAIAHNLAYVEFLQGNHAGCAEILKPWLENSEPSASGQEPAAHALWLRAMHHMGALEEAWDWTQRQLGQGRLGAQAAGVASLIALDLSQVDAAARLSQQALDAGAVQVEPLVARASAALAARDTALARRLLEQALALSPNDGRSWSSLGFAEMLEQKYGEARSAFEKALGTMGEHVETLQGLAWACVMANDLPAAAAALDKALPLDAENAESHGARAVVHALQGEREAAQQQIDRALALDAASVTAKFAQSILSGEAASPDALRRLAGLAS